MRSILLLGAPTPEKLRDQPFVPARSGAIDARSPDEPDTADSTAWPPALSLTPASGRWRRLESEIRAPASIFGNHSPAAPFARPALPAGLSNNCNTIDDYRFAGLDEVSASFALHTAASFDHSLADADASALPDISGVRDGDRNRVGLDQSAIVPPTPRNLTTLQAVASRCRQGEVVSLVAAVISVAPARQVSTKFGTTATLCVVKLGTSSPLYASPSDATATAAAIGRASSLQQTTAAAAAADDVRRLEDRATTLELTLWDDTATSLAVTLRERDVVLLVDACVSRFKNKPGLVSRGGANTTTVAAGAGAADAGARRRGTTCAILARMGTHPDRALPLAGRSRGRATAHRYPYQWLAEEEVSILTGRVAAGDLPDSAGGDAVAQLERHIMLAVDYVRRWLVPDAALEPPSFTSARGSIDHTMGTTTDDTTHDRYTQ